MTVLTPEEASFVPDRIFRLSTRDGIEPNQAVHVVRTVGTCPECHSSLSEISVSGAVYTDRDVIWSDEKDGGKSYTDEKGVQRVTRPSEIDRASAYECLECGTHLRIFVEEKALGRLSKDSEHFPDDLEASGLVYIPYEGGYVRINPQQVSILKEQQ